MAYTDVKPSIINSELSPKWLYTKGNTAASHDNKRHEKRQCNNMLSTKSLANIPYLFPFFFIFICSFLILPFSDFQSVFKKVVLLFTGNVPRGVFCEQSSQKTRESQREIMRMHDFCASRSVLLVTE